VAELVHGFAIGVRDVPQRGLVVRVTPAQASIDLEPDEAAALAQTLWQHAEEAVHASRARRRQAKTCRAPSRELGYDCSMPEGHTGKHGYAGCFW
jgi:hypothetical protein